MAGRGFGRSVRGDRRALSELYAGLGVAKVAGVLQLVALAYFLDATDFGRFALATAWAAAVGAVIDFRAFEAIIVFVQNQLHRGDGGAASWTLRHCFRVDVGTGVLAFALLAVTSPFAADVLLKDRGAWPLIVAAAAVGLFATADLSAVACLRILDDTRTIALADGVLEPVRRVLVIGAVAASRSSLAALATLAVAQAVTSAWLLAVALRRLRSSGLLSPPPARPSRSERKRLWHFLLGTNVFASLKMLSAKADQLLVGLLIDPAAAGALRLAFGVVDLHTALVGPLTTMAYPQIVEANAVGPDRLAALSRAMTARAVRLAVGGAVVLLCGTALVAWLAPLDVSDRELVTLVALLLVGSVVALALFWSGFVLMARRRLTLVNVVAGVKLATQCVLSVALISIWGVVGAAIAASAAIAFSPVVYLLLYRSGRAEGRIDEDEVTGSQLPGPLGAS